MMTGDTQRKILVVGCGNRFCGDDAAGLEVVHRLGSLALSNLSLREMEDFVPGFLYELAREASVIVIVDAVRSGAVPGTIHFVRWPDESLSAEQLQGVSTHSLGLRAELELALIYRAPVDLYLLGIEIGDARRGIGLSDAVESAVQYAAAHFREYCQQIVWAGENRSVVA
jgi:hydrogenase maturation protease